MIPCCLHPQKKGFLYIGDIPNLAVSYFSVRGFEGLWRFRSDLETAGESNGSSCSRSDKSRSAFHSWPTWASVFQDGTRKKQKSIMFFLFSRMDGCVGSALLSSLIAWSSANRMAAMGESLLSNGVCPTKCFSFGFEQDYSWRRLLRRAACSD